MKKLYKTPALRFIDLETEGMIAESQVADGLSIDDNAQSTEDNVLSNKQNLWDREGIWK